MQFIKDNKSQVMLPGRRISIYAILALVTYLFIPSEQTFMITPGRKQRLSIFTA
jgi:hypothetical protein